jgi:hypothetical protein
VERTHAALNIDSGLATNRRNSWAIMVKCRSERRWTACIRLKTISFRLEGLELHTLKQSDFEKHQQSRYAWIDRFSGPVNLWKIINATVAERNADAFTVNLICGYL